MPLNSFYTKILSLTGWESSIVSKTNLKKASTPFQRYIAEEIFMSSSQLQPDDIYFSGEHPFIHIKQDNSINLDKIRKLQSKIWNQGRSPFLVIVTPTEMRLFNCYQHPVCNSSEVESKLQIDRFHDVLEDLVRIKDLLHQSKIDSGKIWTGVYGEKLTIKNRVDKKLVSNLRVTRAKLFKNGTGLPLNVIHDLLGRTLFTFYLEDRRILTTDAYPKKPRGVSNFSELLNHREETYLLFEKLKDKFNGDLFPVSKEESRQVKAEHLKEVRSCFYDYDINSKQPSLWRMFQFEFIPIELISAIYEEFMNEEEEEKNGQIKIKENGAYYTKPMLVEFILNEVLPWPNENNKNFEYRILDPACGSGIFLVESYQRLIARWKFSKKRKKIDEESLKRILHNSIFGIDKDCEAIKVAAFSLYLTFLNYLEPIQIRTDYIEKKRKRLDPLIRWSDSKELLNRKNDLPGNNLFQFNTFEKSGVTENKFDIIIGNPPWKKDKPEPKAAKYIKDNNLPAQLVCAYVDYLPSLLKDDGTIAIVISAKILFNTGDIYERFRQKIFLENTIEAIINLAAIREIMFENATAPGCVIVYHRNKELPRKDSILYCVPKNAVTISSKQSLVIDATEIKYLPIRELSKYNSKILKIAMWGNMRDYFFLKRLSSFVSILEYFQQNNKGIGLHSKGQKDKTLDAKLKDYSFIPLNRMQKYYTPADGLETLGEKYRKFRAVNKEIFTPPVLLLKRGTTDTEFYCSYADFKCVFTDRIYGISVDEESINLVKANVAALNSSLGTYFLFLTSSTWSVDKQGDLLHEEITAFPAITKDMDASVINLLADRVDEIATLFMNRNAEITRISEDIDGLIYGLFDVTIEEQALIKDVLSNSVGLQNRYILSKAECSIRSPSVMNDYANALSRTIGKMLQFADNKIWVEQLTTEFISPLNIVIIHFTDIQPAGSSIETLVDDVRYKDLVDEINNYVLEQHSESIYYRRVFKYYKSDRIYLIKPNERRFWTVSQAFSDADSVLSEMLSSSIETIEN